MNKQEAIGKIIIAAVCIVAIVWVIFWLAVHKPMVWKMVYSLFLMAGLFYFVAGLIYDDHGGRLPWRKIRRNIMKKQKAIDRIIIAVCTTAAFSGFYLLVAYDRRTLLWIVVGFLVFLVTEGIYNISKGRLLWRRNDGKHHEKHQIIDRIIIAACITGALSGLYLLAAYDRRTVLWPVAGFLLFLVTEGIYEIFENRLLWRRNKEEHHE